MKIGVNDIRKGTVILHNGDPTLILMHDFHKMGRGGAVNKTKVKNLMTGAITSVTFTGNQQAEVVEITNKNIQYVYVDGEKAIFMDPNTFEQYEVLVENIPNETDFLKEGVTYQGVFFEGDIISLILPKKITLEVIESADAVKGNSSNNPQKEVVLETGAKLNVPLFIKKGDVLDVNTENYEYSGKAS